MLCPPNYPLPLLFRSGRRRLSVSWFQSQFFLDSLSLFQGTPAADVAAVAVASTY